LLGHGFLSLAVPIGPVDGREQDDSGRDRADNATPFQRPEIELYLERAGFGVVDALEQTSSGGGHPWIHILARATLQTPVVGAIAIVVDATGRILFSERGDGGGWSLPGGALDPLETPEDAVVREVREETGLEVTIDRFVGIYMHPYAYQDTERMLILHVFVCHLSGGTLRPTGEAPRHGWFDRRALPEPRLRRLRTDIQGDMIRDAWTGRTRSARDVARRRYV
jgi:ADP-ribose pyrophosphatase YjhB (NUDIX family)